VVVTEKDKRKDLIGSQGFGSQQMLIIGPPPSPLFGVSYRRRNYYNYMVKFLTLYLRKSMYFKYMMQKSVNFSTLVIRGVVGAH
jgi:hypothetical protein